MTLEGSFLIKRALSEQLVKLEFVLGAGRLGEEAGRGGFWGLGSQRAVRRTRVVSRVGKTGPGMGVCQKQPLMTLTFPVIISEIK